VCYFPVLKKYLLGKSHRKFKSVRVNLFRTSETLLRRLRMCIVSQEGSAYYRNSNSHGFAYLLIPLVRKCLRCVASQSTSNLPVSAHDTIPPPIRRLAPCSVLHCAVVHACTSGSRRRGLDVIM
jgi:hypothetical protein